jgi:hypothetical protein
MIILSPIVSFIGVVQVMALFFFYRKCVNVILILFLVLVKLELTEIILDKYIRNGSINICTMKGDRSANIFVLQYFL